MRRIRNGIYLILLAVLSPWLIYRALFQGKNRRGWMQKLFGTVTPRIGSGPCIWVHAVSVGEVLVAERLAHSIREFRPDVQLAVSTTTETGFDLARSRLEDVPVFFWPLDFTWSVRNSIRRIRPSMVVLTELELWPNMIQTCRDLKIPVAVINGRMGQKSFRSYRRWCRVTGNMFQQLDRVMVQTAEYRDRLIELGTPPDRVIVTGNIKFDGLQTDRNNVRSNAIRERLGIRDDQLVWIAGSTQEDEDQMAVRIWRRLAKTDSSFRLILVPRHVDRMGRLARWARSEGVSLVRWSCIGPDELTAWRDGSAVLVVDAIGLLADMWALADVGFVGGSMGRRGGQNMIEPAAYGVPVSFGPNVWNFRDVADSLVQRDAARIVRDEKALEAWVRWTAVHRQEAIQMGQRAQRWVISQQGALRSTVDQLNDLMTRGTREFGGEEDVSNRSDGSSHASESQPRANDAA